jgi:endoglucanase
MQRRAFLRRSLAVLATAALPTLASCSTAAEQPARTVTHSTTSTSVVPPQLTPDTMLTRSWMSYRVQFIQSDGRTMDPLREMATTSEGQSYSLLKAVWLDDRNTFDRVLGWTNQNLRVRGDALFAFLWGRRGDDTWAVLDANCASDADQDIALALIFAHRRWGMELYLRQARAILADLWRLTVVDVAQQPMLTAGNWAAVEEHPTLNPSYFAPYAYRIFAEADPDHPWMALVESAYDVLFKASGQRLDRGEAVGLPPNWCAINRQTGQLLAPGAKLDTNFGYDAFRTYWRIALDAQWFNEPRATRYLTQSDFLRKVWQKEGAVSAVYSHDGIPVVLEEAAVIYGGLIGNVMVAEPALASRLFAEKLAPRFLQQDGRTFWDDPQAYYTQNWLWFGVGLYAEQLGNLAA